MSRNSAVEHLRNSGLIKSGEPFTVSRAAQYLRCSGTSAAQVLAIMVGLRDIMVLPRDDQGRILYRGTTIYPLRRAWRQHTDTELGIDNECT